MGPGPQPSLLRICCASAAGLARGAGLLKECEVLDGLLGRWCLELLKAWGAMRCEDPT